MFLSMELKVNGEYLNVEASTLLELIHELNLVPERVAAEVNMAIISKKDYSNCRLRKGDSVELVNFVGGG